MNATYNQEDCDKNYNDSGSDSDVSDRTGVSISDGNAGCDMIFQKKCNNSSEKEHNNTPDGLGCFITRKNKAEEIHFCDLTNFFSFMHLMLLPTKDFVKWLFLRELLASKRFCERCKENCSLLCNKSSQKKFKNVGGHIWKCPKNRNHAVSVLESSFFYNSKLGLQDRFLFIRCYLMGVPFDICEKEMQNQYSNNLSAYMKFVKLIRNILIREIEDILHDFVTFGDHVEINALWCGIEERKWDKIGKGKDATVFSLLEKESNKILLFEVKDLTSETIIPLIEKYVSKEAIIYSNSDDPWANCLKMESSLESAGYKHFEKKDYSGKKVTDRHCYNTQISDCDAWEFTTKYIHEKNIQKVTLHGHLCEIMWRIWHQNDNIFESFFTQLKRMYPFVYYPPSPKRPRKPRKKKMKKPHFPIDLESVSSLSSDSEPYSYSSNMNVTSKEVEKERDTLHFSTLDSDSSTISVKEEDTQFESLTGESCNFQMFNDNDMLDFSKSTTIKVEDIS